MTPPARSLVMRFDADGRPSMTQPEQMLAWIVDAGTAGVFTHDARRAGIGNPSQRAGEIVHDGHPLRSRREKGPTGSYGTRYWSAILAPLGAEIVAPATPHDHGGGRLRKAAKPAPKPRPAAAPDLFGEAPPIDISYSDRKAA